MLFLISILYLWAAVTIFGVLISSVGVTALDIVLIIFWPLILPVFIVIALWEWLQK